MPLRVRTLVSAYHFYSIMIRRSAKVGNSRRTTLRRAGIATDMKTNEEKDLPVVERPTKRMFDYSK